jgi:DNA repair protein RecO
MKNSKVSGIILSSTNMFEKDKMIELFSEREGKIKLLAKYANTSKFKFGGKLDVGHNVSCEVYQGKTFQILTQCDLVQSYPHIRSSFNRISLCMYALDIARSLTAQNQHNPHLYAALERCLEELNDTLSDLDTVKKNLHANILNSEGILKESSHFPTDYEFKLAYEDYCGRKLKTPLKLDESRLK